MPYEPITPLPSTWTALRDLNLEELATAWRESKIELSSTGVLGEFLERLNREWAIETGVLERLYSITESATHTLIEHGLDASLLASSDTDRPTAAVVSLIQDQEQAIRGVYQLVASGHDLTTSFVQ